MFCDHFTDGYCTACFGSGILGCFCLSLGLGPDFIRVFLEIHTGLDEFGMVYRALRLFEHDHFMSGGNFMYRKEFGSYGLDNYIIGV